MEKGQELWEGQGEYQHGHQMIDIAEFGMPLRPFITRI
jgi:hypothetical protein